MSIKTWQERTHEYHPYGEIEDFKQAEIDELRAALQERDVEIERFKDTVLYRTLNVLRDALTAQRKVLEVGQYALESTLEALEQLGPAYWSERQEEARAAITAIQEQLK